jgi:CheY-like chemotaxis protein
METPTGQSRILVADDEPQMIRVQPTALASQGQQVRIAGAGSLVAEPRVGYRSNPNG